MPNIKLEVAYCGLNYHGWQIQPDKVTVQGVIESRLKKIFPQDDISLLAAGRTDAGVHANGQICSFKVKRFYFTPDRFLVVINKILPDDIEVKSCEIVSDDFHPTYHAKRRIYCYRISSSKQVFINNIVQYPYFDKIDFQLVEEYLKVLKGEHNFFTFSNSNLNTKDFICTIYEAYFVKKEDVVEFWFEGNRFLYNMIRKLVANILYYSIHKKSPSEFHKLLEIQDRKLSIGTFPPYGLTLERVLY